MLEKIAAIILSWVEENLQAMGTRIAEVLSPSFLQIVCAFCVGAWITGTIIKRLKK